MFKVFLLGALFAVCLILGGSTMASRSHLPKSQDKTSQQRRGPKRDPEKERQKYQEELPEATPVERGKFSAKERAHSKLYDHYHKSMPSRTLNDLVDYANANGIMIVGANLDIGLQEILEPDTPENYFGRLVSASEAVIRGQVIRKKSQITEDDSFVFTDYGVRILEVIKDNPSAPIAVGSSIEVTRPGGKVLLRGVIIRAVDEASLALPSNDEIVLFLNFLPETGAYKGAGPTGSFDLDGINVHPLTKAYIPDGVLRDKDSFLHVLRTITGK